MLMLVLNAGVCWGWNSNSNLDFFHAEGLYPAEKGSVIWNGSACGAKIDKFDIGRKAAWRGSVRGQFWKTNNNCYLIFVGSNEADDTIDSELFDWAYASLRVIFVGYVNRVERYLSVMDC